MLQKIPFLLIYKRFLNIWSNLYITFWDKRFKHLVYQIFFNLFSGSGLAYVKRSAIEIHDAGSEIRMDPRSVDAMSPQHLGGDAFPATLLGRSADWSG